MGITITHFLHTSAKISNCAFAGKPRGFCPQDNATLLGLQEVRALSFSKVEEEHTVKGAEDRRPPLPMHRDHALGKTN